MCLQFRFQCKEVLHPGRRVVLYKPKGLAYRFNIAVLIRSQNDRNNKHFLFCPLSSLRYIQGVGGGASTALGAQLCMNNHKLAICFMHRTSTWHNGHLGSSFNYLKTCVAAGACACVRTRGRGFLSRARTHGSRRVACASRSHLAEGKCVFACVLMIVLGHDTHRGILPPCKLILRYYQFTSATLREKKKESGWRI